MAGTQPRGASSTAAALIPEQPTLESTRDAAAGCQACELWRTGTQTVFGEGAVGAEVMLVGEQPGDKEDLAGRPFVGPAGRLLDQALEEAGIDRQAVYVTNVVKHFKWEAKGKRRIHKKPSADEVTACRPWLEAEIDLVRPKVIVALGATAAQALLGKTFKVTRQRGQIVQSLYGPLVTATVHPSSILRSDNRETEMRGFVQDLTAVARRLAAAS